jgi:trimeric autotransporter adhesin
VTGTWSGGFGNGAAATPSIYATADTNTGAWFPAADTFAVSTGGTERWRVNSIGMGIGESSPDTHLHVNGAYSSAQGTAKLQSNDNDAAKLTLWNKDTSPNTDSRRWAIANNQSNFGDFQIQYGTSSTGNPTTAALTIDKSGNVGVGMTPGGSHKIDVTGSAGLSTGTAWTNTSDARIKTDIQTITNALEKITALRPVNFRYTTEYLSVHPELDSEKRYNSFIAQEYGEVFPDAVTNQGDLRLVTLDPKTGKESIEILLPDVQQFTPHDLQMYLVAGMKELVVRVEALEAA